MAITVGIAGITGKFARLVVNHLLKETEVQIRGFCRNANKLPEETRTRPNITIIEGEATDVDKLRQFAQGCDVVVCCYMGDDNLMIDGQKLLIDACEVENVVRYVASDYSLDFTKLEYGRHPTKDPSKHIKEYLETKKTIKGVHILIGAFMETFWSSYFGVFDAKECTLSFYGSGHEVWESTTYDTAAHYTAAVAMDPGATGVLHFLGDRKSIHQIADELEQVYGKRPRLEHRGSLEELYTTMQAIARKDPANVYAYMALFYQYYCTNGQTYLKQELDNPRYPQVSPVTFKAFMQSHNLETLNEEYQTVGTGV
ncbi:hypothetical protein PFICI_11128 [Pestalotiopsis fici W106-1]|uniref:NAD(P)-binding domain-containing protein n=1 Tax=Pestalotiopsis fici (strain W106-1 / CGMCC3.15140) TaxID=1229662 RepID=W3WTZ5_PESFW|nr:uncharacterized protein PFICI_11128 [Pestalotiopsis fici W106-1]ETS77254.1 hypothetical protein PFICI_11128 [Pestalotiopsis fici W106-1]